MNYKSVLIIFLIIFVPILSLCFAQSNDYQYRSAFKLDLEINDTNYFQAEIPESPIVTSTNSIQIYPGEEVFIEVELGSLNEIRNLKSVKNNLQPEKTLIVAFEQISKKHQHISMVLSITNPFDMDLAYKPSLLSFKLSDWLIKKEISAEKRQLSVEVFNDLSVSICLLDMKFINE